MFFEKAKEPSSQFGAL